MAKNEKISTGIPVIGAGKRGESGHIGYLLRQAGNVHRSRMEHALSDFGITLPQFMVLTMLSAYPGVSNADLARLSLLTPQTVSVIVGNLERAQLISRRPHAQHGRIQHIDLTDAGQKLLGRTRSRVHEVEQAMLADLSPDEEVIVRRWLVQVALLERAG